MERDEKMSLKARISKYNSINNKAVSNVIKNQNREINKISKELGSLSETSVFVNEIYAAIKSVISFVVLGGLFACAAIGEYICRALRTEIFSRN